MNTDADRRSREERARAGCVLKNTHTRNDARVRNERELMAGHKHPFPPGTIANPKSGALICGRG